MACRLRAAPLKIISWSWEAPVYPWFRRRVRRTATGSRARAQPGVPPDYHNAEVAGKPVLFKVTLKALLKKSLPELDDAFAQQMGPYKSVDELKDAVRKDIASREEKRVRDELAQRAAEKLGSRQPR